MIVPVAGLRLASVPGFSLSKQTHKKQESLNIDRTMQQILSNEMCNNWADAYIQDHVILSFIVDFDEMATFKQVIKITSVNEFE